MNQNPEQLAGDRIDAQLVACGWVIQDKQKINLTTALPITSYSSTKNGGSD